MVRLFAQGPGVEYQYVKTSWKDVIGDLTGNKINPNGDYIKILGEVPVRGDSIANGFCVCQDVPQLKDAFERFFHRCKRDGTYQWLVKKCYPTVFSYYSEFFN
ncbi:MAG: hypothetical protein JSU72_00860 [Deltaproteobacteria bacterium]|nr:MAG: hypothetical protein JSU72_00860 [Deltaproteobacteria bacterium]